MATDPVCGMFVDERTAELTLARDNRTYYFCSAGCRETFAAPEAAAAAVRRRLAVAWPATVLVLLLTYGPWSGPAVGWTAALLAGIVEAYPGLVFFRGTRDAIVSRVWNMDVLIAVATSAAFGYSVAVLLLPGRLPSAIYFDASTAIVALILTGNYLEQLARRRAATAIGRLGELLPTTVLVMRGDREVATPTNALAPGDRLRVRPGDRFAVDGVVEDGRSAVDESLVTGEPMPVEKGPGDPVVSGSLNGPGALVVRAVRVGPDAFVAEIGRLLTEAEMSQVPLRRLADRIAERFVPVVLLLALAAGAAWAVATRSLPIALLVFVSVAITACPCAFGIATPAALAVGAGRAAEDGILFRGRDTLERAARVDTVVADKTGTLTAGVPRVTEIVPLPGHGTDELLAAAAGVEAGSAHPLARAVVAEARARGVSLPAATDVRGEPGVGVVGTIGGRRVRVARLDGEPSDGPEPLAGPAAALVREARTVAVVSFDGDPIGLLGFADPIRPTAAAAVRSLADEGVRVVLATGDHGPAAAAVARATGIAEVHAGLSPRAKLDLVTRLRREGRHVAVVGDGVNDAPALLAADVGIAIGSGSDVAKAAGGVLLVRSDPMGVPIALAAARRTVAKVRQNLFWALGYNAVLLPIAAGALVPVVGVGLFGVLPILGAVAMGLSSTTVVANSLSLRRAIGRAAGSGAPAGRAKV